jgi:hypothetical protein
MAYFDRVRLGHCPAATKVEDNTAKPPGGESVAMKLLSSLLLFSTSSVAMAGK